MVYDLPPWSDEFNLGCSSDVDYDIERCTRHCAVSGRELKPGEAFYSTLTADGAAVVRRDFGVEAWHGPPEGILGWWKSHVPQPHAKKLHWAPNDVMLELLDQWEADPARADIRYVLSLLLVRRRVLRLEDTESDDHERDVAVLYCPRNEKTYRVPTSMPDDVRAAEIQTELAALLFGGEEQ